MLNEIEVPDVILINFRLQIFDKDKRLNILDRYFVDKQEAINGYEKQVELYNTMYRHVIITLSDYNTNNIVRRYDTDDDL